VRYPSWPERRAVSDRYYARNPERFLGEPSDFFAWSGPYVATVRPPLEVLELGSGPGRDARGFARTGARVRAVDHSPIAIARGRAWPDAPASLRYEEANLIDALIATASGRVGVVYAHMVYMILSDPEADRVAREVHRVLRPGGLHLFAVRSTSDPVAQEGVQVAPDVRVRPPESEPIRYYRRGTLDRFTRAGFERVAAEESVSAHVWYVCDRRP
jgi:SAM-dependent methyltransferase